MNRRHHIRDGAQRLAGFDALAWLHRDGVFVSGRGNSTHAARWAVRNGWLLIVEPSTHAVGWARYVECPVCGHTLTVSQSMRQLVHRMKHNAPDDAAKFVEISVDDCIKHEFAAIEAACRKEQTP